MTAQADSPVKARSAAADRAVNPSCNIGCSPRPQKFSILVLQHGCQILLFRKIKGFFICRLGARVNLTDALMITEFVKSALYDFLNVSWRHAPAAINPK